MRPSHLLPFIDAMTTIATKRIRTRLEDSHPSSGRIVWPLVLAFALAAPAGVGAQGRADWSTVVRSARRGVLTLKTYDAAGQRLGLGSGFRLGDGRIVTNVHVLRGAARVEAFGADSELLGAVTYAEALSASADLAVLPALGRAGPGLALAPAEPEVGEPIIAIGSPQGLASTVSDGLVSAFRSEDGRRFMQITAPISAGSSGGPVLNRQGRVVGVAVSYLQEGQNLNFAVPLRSVQAVVRSPAGRLAFPAMGPTDGGAQVAAAPSGRTADSAGTAFPALRVGEMVAGALTPRSPRVGRGFRVAAYNLPVQKGKRYTIVARSTDFDAQLGVLGPGPGGSTDPLGKDDDSAGGTDAMLVLVAARTAAVLVFVSNVDTMGLGRFRLAVLEGDVSRQVRLAYDTSEAGRWVRVSGNKDVAVLLDQRTLQRASHGRVDAWQSMRYRQARRSSWGTYDNAKFHLEIDCKGERSRIVQLVYYTGERVVHSQDDPHAEWLAAVPGSVGEAFIRQACARAGRH